MKKKKEIEENPFWYREDDNWYFEKSRKLKLPPHCPFASPHLCPRYYESIKILQEVKLIVGISPEKDKELKEKWENSPLSPCIAEETPSIGYTEKPWRKISSVSHFCPEVAYNVFGVFATSLSWYTSEEDREFAYRYLREIGADELDWRWEYLGVWHIHYTECKEYCLLQQVSSPVGKNKDKYESKIDGKEPTDKSKRPDRKIKYNEKKDEFEIWEGNKKILSFPSPAGHKDKILKEIVKAKKPLTKREILDRCGKEIEQFSVYKKRLNKDLKKYKFKIICRGRKYSIISLK